MARRTFVTLFTPGLPQVMTWLSLALVVLLIPLAFGADKPADIPVAEPSFWEVHRWVILSALAVIVGQTVLIGALLIQRRRWHLAELEIHKQRAELTHASRLAIGGELTASIAHEINQPLTAILANIGAADRFLQSKPPALDEIREILDDIRKDDVRATEIIQRIRALLRKRELLMSPLDLNEVVAEVVRMVSADARRRAVMLETDFSPAQIKVLGDQVHLQQVLLNLIFNGMDAMMHTPEAERHLLVRTSRNGDQNIMVSVTDAGHGILPETQTSIFESFFTTKEEGMGLGLGIARSIIKAHGGRIWAENNSSSGATFYFTLPAKENAK